MTSEQAAFYDQLVRKKYRFLYHCAMQVLQDHFLAEDVVMDTFHTAFLKIDLLCTLENPTGWLVRVLQNKLGNCLKVRKRDAELLLALNGAAAAEAEADAGSTPGCGMHLLLLSLERQLAPEDYQLFRLYFIDGMRHAQLAERLDITLWACRKRLQRVRDQVKRIFPEI